ncbi:MAG: hypothetical protein A2008_08760 [Candidatus Wallbacteria bacterium GWC2_49_35]|uniref:Uncharacterized protein n=1 Tax=Candidatus Wallbacteria bacterium GWC2_49_35 TaxID=1817813 RepID=A0A1F7WLM2_9BACT|nr:MAG: hypothetical protein A2008_08760 [Candidatus Wallbacteria bacterium GWC2_49_35]HBC75613.1 hypothetical protein [Candidatus Wallbacteria bacterium]
MNDKKENNKNSIYFKAALSGLAVGLIVFMGYLFFERDKNSGDEYKDFYTPLVRALEQFKTNLAAIYGQAEEIASSTTEITLERKKEFIAILHSNMNQCDKSIKRFDDNFVPVSARASRDDMIEFFNSARALLERIEKALTGPLKGDELKTEFSAIEDDLEKLSRKQISGYTYY